MPEIDRLLEALPDGFRLVGDMTPSDPVVDVSIDSRTAGPGTIFVAVHHRGYAHDGHDFVEDAFARGALAVVVERDDRLLQLSAPTAPDVASPTHVPGATEEGPPQSLPAARHAGSEVSVEEGAVDTFEGPSKQYLGSRTTEGRARIFVPSTARAVGPLAAAVHNWPARDLTIVGVTGTDGKTTTAIYAHEALRGAGLSPGIVSTVLSGIGSSVTANPAHTTTPDATAIQSLLARTVAEGGRAVVLEVTSHALDQGRVDGCEFDLAIITRITHDHLDYHGTYEAYRDSKLGLIDRLAVVATTPKRRPIPKYVICRATEPSLPLIKRRAAMVEARVLTFDVRGPGNVDHADAVCADVVGTVLDVTSWGSVARVESPWGTELIETRLPGSFNVANAIAALTACVPSGVAFAEACEAVVRVDHIAGRMQLIDEGQEFTVIIDFAHTPDALENLLTTVRRRKPARVIVVFGCAGERDTAKRPLMGAIAARMADLTILTDEDPRHEDSRAIIGDIAVGASSQGALEGRDLACIPDRTEAIAYAIAQARVGDVVVFAGKGHETSIITARDGKLVVTPWSEEATVRATLRMVRD